MAKKAKVAGKAKGRGGSYVIRSAEGGRFATKESRTGQSDVVRNAIRTSRRKSS